jgi:hypothetical protein
LPVICVESRQAHQTLKLLATHKTDHNDARGLAHLARTGFFKPVSRARLTPINGVPNNIKQPDLPPFLTRGGVWLFAASNAPA